MSGMYSRTHMLVENPVSLPMFPSVHPPTLQVMHSARQVMYD